MKIEDCHWDSANEAWGGREGAEYVGWPPFEDEEYNGPTSGTEEERLAAWARHMKHVAKLLLIGADGVVKAACLTPAAERCGLPLEQDHFESTLVNNGK